MNVLVACEESQRVTTAFNERGHEAYSIDIKPTSGANKKRHIKGDVISFLINNPYYKWDLIIAHPPCTYLTIAANRWFNPDNITPDRIEARQKAVEFFMFFVEYQRLTGVKMCIENPVGYMNTHYKKPSQIIHPYMFGDPYSKRTCLWLYNLPLLHATNILKRPENGWQNQSFDIKGRNRGFNGSFSDSELRSKTFPGIAKAMAEQWGKDD